MIYDVAIIGSGGGAFAAAIAARGRDASVVMVERGTVGGTCVNTGCVPSKALLAAAEARHVALDDRFPGIRTSAEDVVMAELIAGKAALVATMQAEKYVNLATDYGWEIVAGSAQFIDGPALEVTLNDGGTRGIEARHYVVATGSAPWVPQIDGLGDIGYLTSTTAMELNQLPGTLLVIGGNYVGLEQAQLFSRLGSKVTVVETLERLAPGEEPEISDVLTGVFLDEGIDVLVSSTVTRVHRDGEDVVATVRTRGGEREVRAEQLLVATGRRPVSDGLGLDVVGVKVGERGEVVVDSQLRTTNPQIWAAGDVTGHPQFVYVAGAHGSLVIDNALGDAGRTLDYTYLPRVTFTTPNIAAVGLTDAQTEQIDVECTCRVLPLEYVPRALVNRDTRGLVKIVAERDSGRVLGVHVISANAGDVILAGVYALAAGFTVEQMATMWCPYLTMGEGLKLAAQTFTRDVSKLSCCAS